MRRIDSFIRLKGRYFKARNTVALFKKHLKANQRLIDIGAGTCRISKYLVDNFDVDVVPIDIVDYNRTNLEMTLYDSTRIPFRDGEFDTALLIFVLHHSNDQEAMLKEAKRVARGVIILEDTPKNSLEKGIWHCWDWLLNWGRDVSMVYSARKDEEWLNFFERLGFNLIEKRNFRRAFSILWLYQHTMYILEVRTT
jgi:ubiquinone/menaquinone biosynthesis C-methylase UbiE